MIGKSLKNVDIYLLDDQNNVITDEINQGQIFITGEQIALGYINDNDLNNKKFIEIEVENNIFKRGFLTGKLFIN